MKAQAQTEVGGGTFRPVLSQLTGLAALTPKATHVQELERDLAEARSRQNALRIRIGYGDKFALRCKPAVDKTVDRLIKELETLEAAHDLYRRSG